jgi:hypothetical protein
MAKHKSPPKDFKPELLDRKNDAERAQLLAQCFGVPVGNNPEETWAALGRELWKYVPRGGPGRPKELLKAYRRALLNFIVVRAIHKRGNGISESRAVELLKKREPFKNMGDLERRYRDRKKHAWDGTVQKRKRDSREIASDMAIELWQLQRHLPDTVPPEIAELEEQAFRPWARGRKGRLVIRTHKVENGYVAFFARPHPGGNTATVLKRPGGGK